MIYLKLSQVELEQALHIRLFVVYFKTHIKWFSPSFGILVTYLLLVPNARTHVGEC